MEYIVAAIIIAIAVVLFVKNKKSGGSTSVTPADIDSSAPEADIDLGTKVPVDTPITSESLLNLGIDGSKLKPPVDMDGLTKKQLLAVAKTDGVKVSASWSKAKILAQLK